MENVFDHSPTTKELLFQWHDIGLKFQRRDGINDSLFRNNPLHASFSFIFKQTSIQSYIK